MAERYAKYAKAKQAASGASRFTPPGGSNIPGGTSSGTPPSGGTLPPGGGGGGVGLLPDSAVQINIAIDKYEEEFGQRVEYIDQLVETGIITEQELQVLQSTAPEGAQWGIDPTTGLVTAVYP